MYIPIYSKEMLPKGFLGHFSSYDWIFNLMLTVVAREEFHKIKYNLLDIIHKSCFGTE